jgi:uncharacterized protein YjbI with pentapeptide repeats
MAYRTLILVFAAFGFASCVGDSEASNVERCVPGRISACICADGEFGAQVCGDDGRFDSCVCGDEPLTDVGDVDVDAGDVADIEDTTPPDTLTADTPTADAPESDVEPDTAEPDIVSDVEPSDILGDLDVLDPDVGDGGLTLGTGCSADSQCASGICRSFSTGAACSEECLGDCGLEGWECFNRECTPSEHCDLDLGEDGVGPGCDDAHCFGCPTNSICAELPFGRYECACDAGYEMIDFVECIDIDECALGIAGCAELRICENTFGGFNCACSDGYFGEDCAECPGGIDNICFGRGTCDDGSLGTGVCDCLPRFGGDLCDVDCFDAEIVICADADLTGANLSSRDFTGADFTRSLMNELNLSASTFASAVFMNASIRLSNAIDSNFTSADFSRADCTGTNFRDGTLTLSSGPGITMADAVLTNVTAEDIDWVGINLTNANLSDARMPRANLSDADGRLATFDRVDATGGDIRGANFTDASMQGFIFFGGFATETDFTRVRLNNANLGEANLSSSIMRNTDLSGITASLVNFRNCDLFAALLIDANLAGAVLTDADASQANFTRANLSGANLTNLDLTNANMRSARTEGAVLTGITWSNTTCPDGTNSDFNGGTCAGNLFVP